MEIERLNGDLSAGDLMSTITYIATDACGNISESHGCREYCRYTATIFHELPRRSAVVCGEDYPTTQSLMKTLAIRSLLVGLRFAIDFQPCANNTLITRTFIISDNSGNEATQTQSITFLDEIHRYC